MWTSECLELSAKGDTVGDWDGDRLSQVLQNLLGNALQHGSAVAPVRVKLDGTMPDAVPLEVWNAGAMSEAVRAQAFAPLKRPGMRNSAKSRGLGLGVFIVQQVVEALGGSVELYSSAVEGTTFVVTIPRTPPLGYAGEPRGPRGEGL